MKNKSLRIVLIVLSVAIATTLTIWPTFRTAAQSKDKPATKAAKSKPATPANKSASPKPGYKVSPVDQADIEKAMKEVEQAMQNLQNVELPQVQIEIEKAMKEIDMNKIQLEVQAALKEVDMEKIQLEVKKAMKDVDMQKINAEIQAAMKEVDMKAIEKELAAAKAVNMEQVKKQMELAKEQMAKSKIDIKAQMALAGEQIKKAKAQLQLMKEGLDELEKDGLKKKDEKVNIEYKDGIMYLNGAAQTQQVSDKYKKYFGEGNFKMNLNDDDNDNHNNEVIK